MFFFNENMNVNIVLYLIVKSETDTHIIQSDAFSTVIYCVVLRARLFISNAEKNF